MLSISEKNEQPVNLVKNSKSIDKDQLMLSRPYRFRKLAEYAVRALIAKLRAILSQQKSWEDVQDELNDVMFQSLEGRFINTNKNMHAVIWSACRYYRHDFRRVSLYWRFYCGCSANRDALGFGLCVSETGPLMNVAKLTDVVYTPVYKNEKFVIKKTTATKGFSRPHNLTFYLSGF